MKELAIDDCRLSIEVPQSPTAIGNQQSTIDNFLRCTDAE
jgi:hypothetical protein